MKVYIAGKYLPKNCSMHDAARVAHENVQAAIQAGCELVKRGHLVHIPHFTHYMHLSDPELSGFDWHNYVLEWLRCCAAILMLPGWTDSTGASLELRKAREWGLKVYYDVEEITPLYGKKIYFPKEKEYATTNDVKIELRKLCEDIVLDPMDWNASSVAKKILGILQ